MGNDQPHGHDRDRPQHRHELTDRSQRVTELPHRAGGQPEPPATSAAASALDRPTSRRYGLLLRTMPDSSRNRPRRTVAL